MEKSIDPRDLQVFVHICRHRSLSKAARSLGLPNSHVSRRLKNLESALGFVLIHRGTRYFELTETGEKYGEMCAEAFDRLASAHDFIAGAKGEPQGTVRLMCPFEYGLFLCDHFLPGFARAYPRLSLDLSLKNRPDLQDYAAKDAFIEVGSVLAPGNFLQVRIATVQRKLFGSPAFLAARRVRKLEDLSPGWLLRLLPERGRSSATDLVFVNRRTGVSKELESRSRLGVNSLTALKKLALAGEGLCFVPDFVVAAEKQAGLLHPVLPDWSSHPIDIFAVASPQRRGDPKVDALIRALSGKGGKAASTRSRTRPAPARPDD